MSPLHIHLSHPNRDKPVAIATRAIVILLLLISIAMMLAVAVGGWSSLAGQRPALVAYVLIYLVLAYYTYGWRRGVLPIIASLAVILAIFSAVAGASWFARDKTGFATTALGSNMLGLITYLIIPVQVLLAGFAARGFAQNWHVEVEHDHPHAEHSGGASAHPA